MNLNPSAKSGALHLRLFFALALCTAAVLLGRLSLSAKTKSPTTNPDGNWSIVHSPDMTQQVLIGVTCVSTTDCWTVGSYVNENGASQTLAQHWSGNVWSTISSPNTNNTNFNRLVRIFCNSASDCWAVGRSSTGGVDSTLIEHWNGIAWSIVSSPNTGNSSRLTSISCITTTDCWAVGYSSPPSQALAMHWNGAAWSIIASPNFGFTNRLLEVTCTSSTNCWAVGYYFGEVIQTLIERWNGTSWAVVTSPNTSPTFYNFLSSITCTSASDCWAVGYAETESTDATLIEHWNGNAWSISNSPNSPTGNSELLGVTCVSSSDCWAVGDVYEFDDTSFSAQGLTEHWNGSSWSVVAAASTIAPGNSHELSAVSCSAAAQCWAIGDIDTDTTLIERWDGSNWSVVTSPTADGGSADNYLFGSACNSTTDCWGVGFYRSPFIFTPYQTLIQRWDGNVWGIVPSPNVDQKWSFLYGVNCAASSDCWAVGTSYTDDVTFDGQTLVEHWDGNTWSIVSSPNADGDTGLNDITCISTSDCWAVGRYYNKDDYSQTVILHWNGAGWSLVASPNNGALDNFLKDVACTSAANCWAAGYYADVADHAYHTLMEHWDGANWSIVSSPDGSSATGNRLEKVFCNSVSDCWAAGSYDTGTSTRTLILHWDGALWNVSPSPNANSFPNELWAVTCTSATNCWAVGEYDSHPGSSMIYQTLALYWDGNVWSLASSPSPNSLSSSRVQNVTCPTGTRCFSVGYYKPSTLQVQQTLIEAFTPLPPLTSFLSRKAHGGAGTFDATMALDGSGVECRSGGVNGDFTVVFNFANTLFSVGNASVTAGTASVSSSAIGADAHQYVVNLTGVANAQRMTVTLGSAQDSAGNIGSAMSNSLGLLIGDTNGDGQVNSADISQTKSQSGQSVSGSNFREDVNTDGSVNSADISLVKSKSGTALPSMQPLKLSHRE